MSFFNLGLTWNSKYFVRVWGIAPVEGTRAKSIQQLDTAVRNDYSLLNLGTLYSIENKPYYELQIKSIPDFGSLGTEYGWNNINKSH